MKVGEMKKVVSIKLVDMTKKLEEILDNLEDYEKKRILETMSDKAGIDYPKLYDIDEFNEVLGSWTPSEIMMNTSDEFFMNFNEATTFYIDECGFVNNGDDYFESYFSIYDVKKFLENYGYDVETMVDAVDAWEENYNYIICFQEELETWDNEEVFDEDDYEYYELFKEIE